MIRPISSIRAFLRVSTLVLCIVNFVAAVPIVLAHNDGGNEEHSTETANPAPNTLRYQWNLSDKESPLLGLEGDSVRVGFDQVLTYRLDAFDFPIFQPLAYDEQHGKYLLPVLTREGQSQSIEFEQTEVKNSYSATNHASLTLIDNDTLKTIKAADGTKYVFVRYPDGEFRCARIKEASGASLDLIYRANGLLLRGVIDNSGRTVTFNYGSEGINSISQTWMANSEGITKTWPVGAAARIEEPGTKYAHATPLKALPFNAVIRQYTAEMAASDKLLADIFGGPTAIAGGNGFEPSGLSAGYPLYRGDIFGNDGIRRRGHLSYAMHLYGSPDGTGASSLYVPAGFTAHSAEPSPTDAVVTFYYPRLGNLNGVTLAVFHVADFQITTEGKRVRIGNLGGPGGSSSLYKHSHIEFYRGDTCLPRLAARAQLRIDPALVFSNATQTEWPRADLLKEAINKVLEK